MRGVFHKTALGWRDYQRLRVPEPPFANRPSEFPLEAVTCGHVREEWSVEALGRTVNNGSALEGDSACD